MRGWWVAPSIAASHTIQWEELQARARERRKLDCLRRTAFPKSFDCSLPETLWEPFLPLAMYALSPDSSHLTALDSWAQLAKTPRMSKKLLWRELTQCPGRMGQVSVKQSVEYLSVGWEPFIEDLMALICILDRMSPPYKKAWFIQSSAQPSPTSSFLQLTFWPKAASL